MLCFVVKTDAKLILFLTAIKLPVKGIFLEAYELTFVVMLDKLRTKWGVAPLGLILILCTFAIGGSLAGFLAKKVMNILSVDQDWLYGISYIILVTLLWPLSVITVSVLFGQFRFFSNYLKKMGRKLGLLRGRE